MTPLVPHAAARLALLIMRAEVAQRLPLGAAARYILLPNRVQLSVEEAAAALSSLPKPLECRVEGRDLAVAIEAATVASPRGLKVYEVRRQHIAEHGGLFPNLAKRVGNGYSQGLVRCLGFNETLLVEVADVEQWREEYVRCPGGYSASPPTHRSAAPELVTGVDLVMKCYWSAAERAAG